MISTRPFALLTLLSCAVATRADEPRVDLHGDPLPPGVVARLGTARLRHAGGVSTLGYVHGGRWLLSAGADGTTRLWDARTGKEHRRFPAAASMPCLSPDGKLLVTGIQGARVWDVETGKEVAWSPDKQSKRGGVLHHRQSRFSTDGRTLHMWGAWCETIQDFNNQHVYTLVEEWDVPTGKRTKRAVVPLNAVVAPDGKTYVAHLTKVTEEEVRLGLELRAVGSDQRLQYWTGKNLRRWSFTPDSKTLVAVDGDQVVAWDVQNGKEKYRIRVASPMAEETRQGPLFPTISPDGRWIASREEHAPFRLWIWEAASGKIVHQVARASPVSFSADGSYLIARGTVEPPAELSLLEVATGKIVFRLKLPPLGRDELVAFAPDGKTLAVSNSQVIELYDIPSGKQKAPFGPAVAPLGICYNPDGATLATWTWPHAPIRFWDPATGRELSQAPGVPDSGNIYGRFFWLPDGTDAKSRLVYLNSFSSENRPDVIRPNRLQMTNVASGKQIRSFARDGGAFAVSPDGRLIATHGREQIVIWDAVSGREIKSIKRSPVEHETAFTELLFSRNGKALASLGRSRPTELPSSDVAVLELATGKERWRLPRSAPAAKPLLFHPDGKKLLLGSELDGHLWDMVADREIRRFGPLDTSEHGLRAFSPDGKLLAALARNATRDRDRAQDGIALWEADTGTSLEPLELSPISVISFAFAPDGKTLAVACSDTTVLIYDVAELLRRKKTASAGLDWLWNDLASEEGAKAFKAMALLESRPEAALTMLKAKAIPIRPANADALKRLIADLDSDVYPRRASAMRALEQLGDLALSAMCARLKDDPPLETKRRLEELIAKNETAAPLPDIVRLLRAIEVLEQVNTAESRQILASLAEGADPHRVTTAARAALKGLRSR